MVCYQWQKELISDEHSLLVLSTSLSTSLYSTSQSRNLTLIHQVEEVIQNYSQKQISKTKEMMIHNQILSLKESLLLTVAEITLQVPLTVQHV